MELPCPHCSEVFMDLEALLQHTLDSHYEGGEMKDLTRQNFRQEGEKWICDVGTFTMVLEPENEHFKLRVTGTVEPIPTRNPTEPEWDEALRIANQFYISYMVAKNRE